MRKKGHTVTHNRGLASTILIAVSLQQIGMLAAAALGAWLIAGEYLDVQAAGYLSMLATSIGAVIGGLCVFRSREEKKWLLCMISSACAILVMLGINIFAFGGQMSGFGPTVLLVMGISGAMALLALRKQSSGGKRASASGYKRLYKMHK